MSLYLDSQKYKTKNVIKGYKMKFSKMSDNQELYVSLLIIIYRIEAKFAKFAQIAEEIQQKRKEYEVAAEKEKDELESEIKRIKYNCDFYF